MIRRRENQDERDLSAFEIQKNVRKNDKYLDRNYRHLLDLLGLLNNAIKNQEQMNLDRHFNHRGSLDARVQMNKYSDRKIEDFQKRKREIIEELRSRNEAIRSLPQADLIIWIQLKQATKR